MIQLFVTAMYIAVAGLCVAAGFKTHRVDRNLWFGLGAVLFLLAVDRAFNLGEGLTQFGRFMAYNQGWYRERRPFQRETIIGVCAVGALLFVGATWRLRRFPKYVRFAVAGGLLLCGLAVLHIISYHYMDAVLRHRTVKFRIEDLLALAGLGAIAFCATVHLYRQSHANA